MYKKSLIITFFFLILINCSKNDPVTGEKVIIEPDPTKRAAKIRDEGGGIFGDINKTGKGSNTFDFASSNALWRATLKALEFLPLINADYSGGVIIYDWYSDDINSKEQVKISIKFLSNEIRSDSIQIIAHKKICNQNERCSTSKLDNSFSSKIKDSILTEARSLKIEDTKKEKR
jgi:hypothetical protein